MAVTVFLLLQCEQAIFVNCKAPNSYLTTISVSRQRALLAEKTTQYRLAAGFSHFVQNDPFISTIPEEALPFAAQGSFLGQGGLRDREKQTLQIWENKKGQGKIGK